MEFCSIRIGWPGTTPVSQALPWALAWSTILCCPPHTGCPSLYSRGGRHLHHGKPWQSDEQHVPVPMVSLAAKTDPASKTAGLVVHRGRPTWKVPPPASLRPPRINSATRLILDGPTQFAFADPLRLPTLGVESLLLGNPSLLVGFPPCGRPLVGHSGEERFGHGWEPCPIVVPSAS